MSWACVFPADTKNEPAPAVLIRTRAGVVTRVAYVGTAAQVLAYAEERGRVNRRVPTIHRDVHTLDAEEIATEEANVRANSGKKKRTCPSGPMPAKRIDQTTLRYDDAQLPYVTCTPHLARGVRLYHIPQQQAQWFKIREGRVTATAATNVAGLNRYEYPWDYVATWMGATKRPEDAASADVMAYGNTFEDRNRRLFSHITGLQVAETGFVIDVNQERRGISPDGFVQPAHLTATVTSADLDTQLPADFDTGLALFEAKCSPYSLAKYFKVLYVGQVHAQMAITGIHWCWASMWHQDQLRVVLIKYSAELWAWINLRVEAFLAICDRNTAPAPLDETAEAKQQRLVRSAATAAAEIRACSLWRAEVAEATESDWYPTSFRDQPFAARFSGKFVHTNDTDNKLIRYLEQLLPGWRERTPHSALRMLPPRPRIYPVYCQTKTALSSEPRADRGYVERTAWPAPDAPLPLDNYPPIGSAGYSRTEHGDGVILTVKTSGPMPEPIAIYQPLYAVESK